MVARPSRPPRARLPLLVLLALLSGSCSEAQPPPAPAPQAAQTQARAPRVELDAGARPEPIPTRPTRLAGRVVDPFGAPVGAGVRVAAVGHAMGELLSPAARRAEVLGATVVTDDQGRFELGPRELDLPLPLRLVAVSESSLGTLRPSADGPVQETGLRLVVHPLVGRRVRLIDQERQAVRWPVEALSASVVSSEPNLALLDPDAIEWSLLPYDPLDRTATGNGERVLLAELRDPQGGAPPSFAWSLELAGYDFARLRVELLPLAAGVPLELLEGTLERTAPGFGAIVVSLPPGLGGAEGEELAPGIALVLEPRAGRRSLAYELRRAHQGRVHLADIPAGEYGARLEVRGIHRQPPADAPALSLSVPVDGEVPFEPGGPAWSAVEFEIELPSGELSAGRLHLELSAGKGQSVGSAPVREFRSFAAAPYRFAPSPAGHYTVHVRRLPGFVEAGEVRDPFLEVEEQDLPWTDFELRPGHTSPVRLRLAR